MACDCGTCGVCCPASPPFVGPPPCCCDWPCQVGNPPCPRDPNACPGCGKINCPPRLVLDPCGLHYECGACPAPTCAVAPTGGCGCGGNCGGECGCGGSCGYGSGIGSPASDSSIAGIAAAAISYLCPSIAGSNVSVGQVSPNTGNLSLGISVPTAGQLDPPLKITYNSLAAANSIQFGYGWSDLWNSTVGVIDSITADIATGDGRSFIYTNKDGSGRYLAPATVNNSLQQLASGGFAQTQPNGMQ